MSRKDGNKKKVLIIAVAEILVLALLLILLLVPRNGKGGGITPTPDPPVGGSDQNPTKAEQPATKTPEGPTATPTATPVPATPTMSPTPTMTAAEVLAQQQAQLQRELEEKAEAMLVTADRLAAMYDYDAAIAVLQSLEGYEQLESLTGAITGYEQAKAACVVWKDNTTISHCFFHSLIADTSLAFGPNSGTLDGYNRYMTTISEFEKILQQMYDKGYVLIRIHDMAEIVVQADGTELMTKKEILLPEGKIPFVMSQDDVNYYDYMDGEGFATKIVVGADGKPTCEYINKDGTVVTGDYDLVPVLDKFIEAHPDFSYRGAKAILAITGYEGTLGYETAPYRYDEVKALSGMTEAEKAAKLASEQEACRLAVAALKADGYEFASHSYGHGNMQTNSVTKYCSDMDRWFREVSPLIGETDIYIYPFGADICDWRGYSGDKYDYAIKNGFRYFCNVDSAQYWVQIKSDYLRQGRINFDGERMFKNPDKLVYFYDVDSVLDPARPYKITD